MNGMVENWNALEGLLNSLVNAFCGDPASEKKHTLDEATSSDCACGVLASLDHPKSSILTGSDRHSLLEHSLPVATALVEFWSRWTTLNLAFFSVQPQRKHKMILGSMIPVAPLEHSLPVASVLVEFFRRWGTINLAFFSLRPRRKHKIIPGSMFPNPPLEHSLPVASVLTGSDRHSLLEHYLS